MLVALFAVGALVFAAAVPGVADARGRHGGWHRGGHGGHFHSSFFFGIGPFWPVAPWYAYPWYAYPPVVVESQPVIIERQPSVYIQQPPPPPAQETYWYYCPDSKAYYPYVQSCSEPWVRVAPNPQR
jgi:hypothetical protein